MKTAFSFVLLISISGCSSISQPLAGKRNALPDDARGRLGEIQIGMSRSTVEAMFGPPLSLSRDLVGAPGEEEIRVTAQYMPGMVVKMPPTQQRDSAARPMGTFGAIVQQGLGLAGLAGPVGGVAGGIGSSLMGMASSPESAEADPIPDQIDAAMDTLIVRYRDDRVIGVQRMNPSNYVPPAPDEEEEPVK